MVEALWRCLKRLTLYLYNRPPLDLAVYAIITRTLPPYRLTISKITGTHRAARAPSLSYAQQQLKKAWDRLLKVPLRGSYTTDIANWTCDCGSQKYHSHLLCKHLVQKAGRPPASWWPTAVRYHIAPFYTVPINGSVAQPPESVRSHAWTGRLGKRSAVITRPSVAAPKRIIQHIEDSDSDSDIGIPSVDKACVRSSSPILSSPGKEPPTGPDGIVREQAGGGAGFEIEDENTINTSAAQQHLMSAIEILGEQTDERFLLNAKTRLHGTVRWVAELDEHPVPAVEALSVTKLIEYLQRAHALLQEIRENPSQRKLEVAKRHMKNTLAWVQDILRIENRRTMPLTNVRARNGRGDPTNTIGYRYRKRM
ncbi:hypothetical protein C8Q73DRAFT_758343 [Cubamyces lactineus]|nr:hypothetical protein C8Q73DRAFT_758343 [Cubamyces lactineus]